MVDCKSVLDNFCKENDLMITLSYDMPCGYETAFGTYDVTINTLVFNRKILQNAAEHEVLFYLYHELRHALQYLRPELFDEKVQESCYYVVLYNGTCYKLIENSWQKCVIDGTEEYFLDAYLNLPYEIDANTYAYQMVKSVYGDSIELQELYSSWMPQRTFSQSEYKRLFGLIDRRIEKKDT